MEIRDVPYTSTLYALKLVASDGLLDLTKDDYAFLTSERLWIALDRARARKCIEAVVYGSLDALGLPRFAVPAEMVAASIVYFVHPSNLRFACLVMEGCQFSENIINGIDRPLKASELFAHVLRCGAGHDRDVNAMFKHIQKRLKGVGVEVV